jgi:hypothetical protein
MLQMNVMRRNKSLIDVMRLVAKNTKSKINVNVKN